MPQPRLAPGYALREAHSRRRRRVLGLRTRLKTTLIRLSDRDLALADGDEDIRGRDVLHTAGEDLGGVSDLLIDAGEKKAGCYP